MLWCVRFCITFLILNDFQADGTHGEDSLSLENTLWANTVVASGTALGLVVYTGPETRSVMNTSKPSAKIGLIDLEINTMTKILFVMMAALSLLMMVLKVSVLLCRHGRAVGLLRARSGLEPVNMSLTYVLLPQGFNGPWYRYLFRFIILFSYIIPIRFVLNALPIPYELCWLQMQLAFFP